MENVLNYLKVRGKDLLILCLSIGITWFATRNYRNELLLASLEKNNQYNYVFIQTSNLLNQINWKEEDIKVWRSLGYTIQPKLAQQPIPNSVLQGDSTNGKK